MKLSVKDWDNRFSEQAGWTKSLRRYLYERIELDKYTHIIEIGCGTGAILKDFDHNHKNIIYGLDISEKYIHFAQKNLSNFIFTLGDAHTLPFKDDHFEVILCHFFLLWVANPYIVLQEIRRILRENGILLILAEPDYSGRIDYPDNLRVLGDAQTESLKIQGADPFIGRRLGSLLHECEINLREMGILGGHWERHHSTDNIDREWQMLLYDLSHLSGDDELDKGINQDIHELEKIHIEARRKGARVIYVPTFYAWGQI